MTQTNTSLEQTLHLTIKHLDANAFLLVDGLYRVLGNHGTTPEHLKGVLDGIADGLYDCLTRLTEHSTKASKRAKDLLDTLDALCTLAGVQLDE